MLPYDGMTRTGSKGVSHPAFAETPSEARKVLERQGKSKPKVVEPLTEVLLYSLCHAASIQQVIHQERGHAPSG